MHIDSGDRSLSFNCDTHLAGGLFVTGKKLTRIAESILEAECPSEDIIENHMRRDFADFVGGDEFNR